MSSGIFVTVRHDKLWSALEWAKEYCPSYITNDLHMDGYNTYDYTRVDYFFGSEEDAIAFKLKFGL
jgi:hypothetical protein